MAMIGNKLYRGLNSKREEAAEIDQQLSRLEDDIRKLKIEFDIYFKGKIHILESPIFALPNGWRYLRWGGDGEAVQPEK